MKGFLVNHLNGTVTAHLNSSIYLTLTPLKKAAGNFANKNKRTPIGLFILFTNLSNIMRESLVMTVSLWFYIKRKVRMFIIFK